MRGRYDDRFTESERLERAVNAARRRAWRRAESGHRLFVQAEMAFWDLYVGHIPWWACS